MASLPFYLQLILTIIIFSFIISLFKPNKNGLPRNWPILGMSVMLFLNFHRLSDKFAELLEKSKGTFLITGPWFANIDMLATSDPSNIHYITTKNFWNYPKGSESKELFDLLGNMLFNLDFDEWIQYRRITNAFLKHHQFHRFANRVIVDNVNRGLVPVLDHVATKNLVVDLQDLFKRHTYDAACMMTTGYNPNSLSIDFSEVPFIKAIDDACEAIFYRHIMPRCLWRLKRWLQLGSEKKGSAAAKTLREVMGNYLLMKTEEIKLKQYEEEEEESFDALRCFLTVNEVTETTHPEEIVRDSIIGLTFAAYDTSAPTLSWFFWLLSKNPRVEAKIKEELKNNFSNTWKLSSKDELSKLIYLHAALCETLRLYPSVPLQHRSAVKPDVLPSGHYVNKKVRVIMCGYGIGRMSSVWGDDCLEFMPERWIDEKGRLKYEPPNKFLVFNAGPRNCLGKEVAFRMMKAAAATIVYNYDIQVVETRLVVPKPSIILQMKDGIRVRVKRKCLT